MSGLHGRLAGFVWGAVGALGPPALADQSESSPPAPNFVVIVADDLSATELGCYGHPGGRTPRLDRLAREGMRFETCWATPLCTPTRVMLLTGKYGYRTGYYGIYGGDWAPPVNHPMADVGQHPTFADALKSQGYATALAGKWQLSGTLPGLILDCGFDRYRVWAFDRYVSEEIRERDDWQRPGRARYWHPRILEDGEFRPTQESDFGPNLYTEFLLSFIAEAKDRPFLAYYPMRLPHRPWGAVPDARGRPGKKGFDANVAYLDSLVGRILDGLEANGLAGRTWVVFTSDNGSDQKGKGSLTRTGVHVPLLIRGPGIREASVSSALVSLADLMPTLAELAGNPRNLEDIDGLSFAAVLRGEMEAHRSWLYSFVRDGHLVRDDCWLWELDRWWHGPSGTAGSEFEEVTDPETPGLAEAQSRFAGWVKDYPVGKSRNP